MKEIFTYRVNPGAYNSMSRILKYAGQVDHRMDGEVCSITCMYPNDKNIQSQFLKQYENDRLAQVKVLGITDREFLVMESMLEPLHEVVVVGANE